MDLRRDDVSAPCSVAEAPQQVKWLQVGYPHYQEYATALRAIEDARVARGGELSYLFEIARRGESLPRRARVIVRSSGNGPTVAEIKEGERVSLQIYWNYPGNPAIGFSPDMCKLAFLHTLAVNAGITFVSERERVRQTLCQQQVPESLPHRIVIPVGWPLATQLALFRAQLVKHATELYTPGRTSIPEYVPVEVLKDHKFAGHLVLEYRYKSGVLLGVDLKFFTPQGDRGQLALAMLYRFDMVVPTNDNFYSMHAIEIAKKPTQDWLAEIFKGIESKVLGNTSGERRVSFAPGTAMVSRGEILGMLTMDLALVKELFDVYHKVVGPGYLYGREFYVPLRINECPIVCKVSLRMTKYGQTGAPGLLLKFESADGVIAPGALFFNFAIGNGAVGRIVEGAPVDTIVETIIASVIMQLSSSITEEDETPLEY